MILRSDSETEKTTRQPIGPVPHLQLILYVVRQLEELLLPFGLALRVAGEQPLGPRAAPWLPHPLRLRPTWGKGQKAEVRC